MKSARRLVTLALVLVLVGLASLWVHDLLTDPTPIAELKQDPLDPIEEPFDSDSAPSLRVPSGSFEAPSKRSPAVVWAVGDGDASAGARRVTSRIEADRPDRVLYLGDVYDIGSEEDFDERYAPTYGRLARITAPTSGNHDWPNRGEGYEPYWREALGRTPPSFYSFRLAGWQILSLNSEADHGRGGRQVRWLRAQLLAPGTCRLAFWHRPRYSAGTVHGDQPDVEPFWDALAGRAAIVLNGHEHDMQVLRARRGIVELVSGAGGHGRYPIRRSYPGLAFADDRNYGALRLELRPGDARYRFVSERGRVLKSGRIPCRRLVRGR